MTAPRVGTGLVRKAPGDDPVQLVVRELMEEELTGRIPELFLHAVLELGSPLLVQKRLVGVAQQPCGLGDGSGVRV